MNRKSKRLLTVLRKKLQRLISEIYQSDMKMFLFSNLSYNLSLTFIQTDLQINMGERDATDLFFPWGL